MHQKADALAAIARFKAGRASADDRALVLELATDQARALPSPPDPAAVIRTLRQQAKFRLAEHYGWRGGCNHSQFIPAAVAAAFDAKTAAMIAAANQKEQQA